MAAAMPLQTFQLRSLQTVLGMLCPNRNENPISDRERNTHGPSAPPGGESRLDSLTQLIMQNPDSSQPVVSDRQP